ncbi:MAG: PA0069 family radical SAM protein [Saprospiraceae bacterium]|nr:PA0069 family radical SAM protein [Saprospiraceae bacterium]
MLDEIFDILELHKGRGAQINPADPFSKLNRMEDQITPEEYGDGRYDTSFVTVHPKSIVNKVTSPDVGMEYSINPYQGCEHGCVYCYARNTHPYWGYSAGLDFESKIMVKKNAPVLLRRFLQDQSWEGTPIVLSGNTDCYQPIERKLGITRALLQTFRDFDHPVGIITKNSLIQSDLDILRSLAAENLVKVIISITTLDDALRRKLEPRTASVKQRLQTLALLAKEGIPVGVMVAPIIPGLNDHEIMEIIRVSSLMGATKAGYTIVRLNGDVEKIFRDWMSKAYPDRYEKVMSRIAECHGGLVRDSRFGKRMTGEGTYAQIIKDQFKLAVSKYFGQNELSSLNSELYKRRRQQQLMFDF